MASFPTVTSQSLIVEHPNYNRISNPTMKSGTLSPKIVKTFSAEAIDKMQEFSVPCLQDYSQQDLRKFITYDLVERGPIKGTTGNHPKKHLFVAFGVTSPEIEKVRKIRATTNFENIPVMEPFGLAVCFTRTNFNSSNQNEELEAHLIPFPSNKLQNIPSNDWRFLHHDQIHRMSDSQYEAIEEIFAGKHTTLRLVDVAQTLLNSAEKHSEERKDNQ